MGCRNTALTSSEDGTVRVWDTWNVVQKTVIKPTLAKPGRVTVSMARYSNDGHLIVAGLNNGTIQSWDVRGTPLHSAQCPEPGAVSGVQCMCTGFGIRRVSVGMPCCKCDGPPHNCSTMAPHCRGMSEVQFLTDLNTVRQVRSVAYPKALSGMRIGILKAACLAMQPS